MPLQGELRQGFSEKQERKSLLSPFAMSYIKEINSAISICISLKVKQKHIVNSIFDSTDSTESFHYENLSFDLYLPKMFSPLLVCYSPKWKVCLCSLGFQWEGINSSGYLFLPKFWIYPNILN